MYELRLNSIGSGYDIYRLSDNAQIPADFMNKDFRDFIRWVQAGNEVPNMPTDSLI